MYHPSRCRDRAETVDVNIGADPKLRDLMRVRVWCRDGRSVAQREISWFRLCRGRDLDTGDTPHTRRVPKFEREASMASCSHDGECGTENHNDAGGFCRYCDICNPCSHDGP